MNVLTLKLHMKLYNACVYFKQVKKKKTNYLCTVYIQEHFLITDNKNGIQEMLGKMKKKFSTDFQM